RLPLALRLSFPSSLVPPYLHSFPTRRSSDLVPSRITSARSRKPHFFTPAQHLPSSLAPFLIRSSRSIVPAAIRDHSCSRRYPRSDRKSTRLNSSHRTISYAVFCLKKKKKIL